MNVAIFALGIGLISISPLADAAAQTTTARAEAPAEKKFLAVVTNTRADAEAVARANRLTDRMAQQLRLNNYQTTRLRTLNRAKARQMFELEHQTGADAKKIDADCQGLCRDQERDLRRLLSTAQYSDYYEARSDFYAFDKQFLAQNSAADRRSGDGPIVLPGAAAGPELKTSDGNPVLRPAK